MRAAKEGATDIDDLPHLTSVAGGECRTGDHTGTKALMRAVLQNGIESYLGPEGRIRTEAECWLTHPGRTSPFSFTVVCETLGLEPDAVRRALGRLRTQCLRSREAIGRLRPNARQARQRLAG